VLVGVISWRVGGHDKDTQDYLLGNRRVPWWAVLCSIIGTEISALTFVGVPAMAFAAGGTDFTYLQLTLGTILARLVVSQWFVTAFYEHRVVSIYEFLLYRFGPWTRNLAALVFLVTRVLMSGVRLYAGAILVQMALGIPVAGAVALVTGLGLAYTVAGGIQAVIWTEVLQVIVMFGGALTAVFVLLGALPTGWQAVAPVAEWKFLDFSLDPAAKFTLWAALLGTTFQNLAVFGTDYDMVQRMLTAENRQKSRLAIMGSALADVPIAALFLFIGTLLYAYYHYFPDPTLGDAKNVFPHFILTRMPPGAAGLVVAGVLSVLLSTFESALTALAGSFVVDVYRPYLARGRSETHYVKVTRAATVGFGMALALVAVCTSGVQNILTFGLEIGAYTYGALLGVFMVGLFTRRGSDLSCFLSVPVSVASVVLVKLFTPLGFTWFVLIGTVSGFLVAVLGKSEGGPSGEQKG